MQTIGASLMAGESARSSNFEQMGEILRPVMEIEASARTLT
jgi:hypothetical protein